MKLSNFARMLNRQPRLLKLVVHAGLQLALSFLSLLQGNSAGPLVSLNRVGHWVPGALGPAHSLPSLLQGDSGGPLVCRNAEGRWVQAGITSFAASRFPEYSPSVFTRVSRYRAWIQSVMDNN